MSRRVRRARGDGLDPAVAQARGVVGMYGDPKVSWSIALDVSSTLAIPWDSLKRRCVDLVAGRPHLGRPPSPVEFDEEDGTSMLQEMLDTPYGDDAALLRVALSTDGTRLILAAHHGAVDGLGTLACLGQLLNDSVVSTASGIGERRSSVSFVRSSFGRLSEALFTPPTRLARVGNPSVGRRRPGPGDVTARADLELVRTNTAHIVTAAAETLVDWNSRHGTHARRVVAAVGASRRDGSQARPNRDTAYLRARLPSTPTIELVSQVLGASDPEPAFPEHRAGGLTSVAIRVLRGRLGSSLLVSNLGLVDAPATISRIAFYPSAAGAQALAVGVASTAGHTTLTVRMPRADFPQPAADELCTTMAGRLTTRRSLD